MRSARSSIAVTLGSLVALAGCNTVTADVSTSQAPATQVATPVFAVQPAVCAIRDICSVGVGCVPTDGTLTLTPLDANSYHVTGAGQNHILRFQEAIVIETVSGALRSDLYVDQGATTDLSIGRNAAGQRTATLRNLTDAPFPSISARCTS